MSLVGARRFWLLCLCGCVDATAPLSPNGQPDAGGALEAEVVDDAGSTTTDAGPRHRLAALTRCPGGGLDHDGNLAWFRNGYPDVQFEIREGPYLDIDLRDELIALRANGEIECQRTQTCSDLSLAGRVIAVRGRFGMVCALQQDASITCMNAEAELVDFEGPFRALDVASGVLGQYADGRLRLLSRGRPWPDMPTDVSFEQFALITAGGCGLLDDGQLRCWGTFSDAGSGPIVAPAGRFRLLKACLNSFCAIRTSGELYCWQERSRTTWFAPEGRFVDVSAPFTTNRYPRVCALDEDHRLTCFDYGRPQQ